eukprot:4522481-Prymnesium_polylepis.1
MPHEDVVTIQPDLVLALLPQPFLADHDDLAERPRHPLPQLIGSSQDHVVVDHRLAVALLVVL